MNYKVILDGECTAVNPTAQEADERAEERSIPACPAAPGSGHDPGMDDAPGWPLSAGIQGDPRRRGGFYVLVPQRRTGL